MKVFGRRSSAARQAIKRAAQRSATLTIAGDWNVPVYLQSTSETEINLSRTDYQASGIFARGSSKSRNQLYSVLFNNLFVSFDPKNKYLSNPEQLWMIASIIGTQVLRKALWGGKTINNQFIEDLFRRATFAFYLTADELYLLSSDDELTQLDFGPLTKISALTALQRFGISTLEQVKEKTVVRL